MPVCRVIFRVDFDTCFDIMDRPGSVARTILGSCPKDFFHEMREQRNKREVIASSNRSNKEHAYTLTVAVNAIFFSYEITKGIAFTDLKDDERFSALVKSVSHIRKAFDVKSEVRIGFRVFYFGQIGKERGETLSAFRKLIDGTFIQAAEKAAGTAIDYGINLDGKDELISYRMRTGPYRGAEEGHTYLDVLQKQFDADTKFDLVVDLDQSEIQTKYGFELAIWKPYINRASALVASIEQQLRHHMEKGK